ncbi:MAG: DUF1461 domain-containing protein [Clostridia bacterium]|nr:DUF1461 domain-containing protein [Clostridia bacterium]
MKRSSFWTCLAAALLLTVLALVAAVYTNAGRVDLFEKALIQNVDPNLRLDEDNLKEFAEATIFYLNGNQDTWNPRIVVGGVAAGQFIPQSFRDHMATVKGWFTSAKVLLPAGGVISLALLLGQAFIGRKGSGKSRFSPGGYCLGALIPLAAVGSIGLWGVLNFNSLWTALHKTLIPDGIFSALEPVMRLFPVELFAAYLEPVAVTFGLMAAAVLVLPLVLSLLSQPLASLPGPAGIPLPGERPPADKENE